MSTLETLETTIFNEKFGVSANWANAASPVLQLDCDGTYVSTPFQVADFCHEPAEALRWVIEECIISSGDDPDDFTREIDNALEKAE